MTHRNQLQRRKDAQQPHLICTNEGCLRSFKTSTALDQHLLLGNCEYHCEKTLPDRAKVMYSKKVNDLESSSEISSRVHACNFPAGASTSLQIGWAAKQKKKRSNFTESQTTFINDQFNIGKISGRKVDPFVAAYDMRNMKNPDGSYIFTREEYLTGQQIASYFSRLAIKDKRRDMKSAEEENAMTELKSEILDTICDA